MYAIKRTNGEQTGRRRGGKEGLRQKRKRKEVPRESFYVIRHSMQRFIQVLPCFVGFCGKVGDCCWLFEGVKSKQLPV